MSLNELLEAFDELFDWEERCEYLIELGFQLPDFPDQARIEANLVHGCQSTVWLIANVNSKFEPAVIEILADSDAMIVKGLIFVLLTVFSGKTCQEILATDVESIFERIGLKRHLYPARRNGLYSMVKRIRALANQAG